MTLLRNIALWLKYEKSSKKKFEKISKILQIVGREGGWRIVITISFSSEPTGE
jgi:hypothetical protein